MTEKKRMTLKDARLARGLSIEALAKLARIPYASAQAIESGRIPGSLFAKLKLAEALGLRLKDLWPETWSEMDGLVDEFQENDRRRPRAITTNDLDSKGKLTPAAKERRLIEGD